MHIEYMGITIPCISITGLSFSEKIDSDNDGVLDVTITNTPSNRIIAEGLSVGEESIVFKSYTFEHFRLIRDSVVYTNTEIQFQIRHKITEMLAQIVNFNLVGSNLNAANPITIIETLLFMAGISDYASKSQLNALYTYYDDIDETMDACYYQLTDISVRDVLNEVCGKVAVVPYVDYSLNQLCFFSYLNLPIDCDHNEVFRPYVMKKTESVSDEYYNSFKIGIYPDTYVMQQIRYKYKCSNTQYSNVWFDEDDITLEQSSGDLYEAVLKYNKYDVTNTIIYEANSIWTTDITTRQAITVNVAADVQRLSEYSAKTLYGTEENPAWSVWSDDNVYNDTACCRHVNANGAVIIGNEIVRRFYRKQKKLTLDLAKFMPVSNGDIMMFDNTKWILTEQKINDDMSAIMELEELIND